MTLLELFIIGVGLSMDALAVSICKGLSIEDSKLKGALIIGLFFGFFQGAMPIVGWVMGKQFAHIISAIDHWIAFVILGIIGGRMIYNSLKSGGSCACGPLKLQELLLLALATSIDALAVGVTFAFLDVQIVSAALIIGGITFVLSLGGVLFGSRCGSAFGSKAEMLGGGVLILIGLKILLEQTGVFL
jgi:putative Mn2+ efflux pump MntP